MLTAIFKFIPGLKRCCLGLICGACSFALAQATPVFNGSPISMQFQKIELRAALQILADFSGVNLVLADSVSGSLSLRLQAVPWDQALHTILQSKGLGQHREGDVIWVAPLAELAARHSTRAPACPALWRSSS